VNSYVTDTHSLFWYLTNSPLLGAEASQAFDEADAGAALIYVPAIVLAELYFLNEKQGRSLDFAAEYGRINQSGQFVLVPFLPEDTLDLETDRVVPEMHDRLIAGVARRMNMPCITKDPQIVQSNLVVTIW
jgi:PIN domain nuclease of toxin-antitoxin system